MHFCQDEAAGIAVIITGGIGTICRYCWYKITFWRNRK